MKKMNNKGFSLVELIVVIAIMAVLVGVLAPQFIKYVESSRKSTDIQNIQQLKTAVEVYAAGSQSTDTMTIEISSAKTATAKKGGTTFAQTDLGCNPVVNLKVSTAWNAVTYTFTPATGSWGHTGTENTEIAAIFE